MLGEKILAHEGRSLHCGHHRGHLRHASKCHRCSNRRKTISKPDFQSQHTHISIPQTGQKCGPECPSQISTRPLPECGDDHRSPGLNEDFERTDISLQQIAQADVVIMVLSCEMALSRSEMNFIGDHLSDRHFGLFFVWNRYDSIRDNPDECENTLDQTQSLVTTMPPSAICLPVMPCWPNQQGCPAA